MFVMSSMKDSSPMAIEQHHTYCAMCGKARLKAKFNLSLHPCVVATQYGWWNSCTELDLVGYDPLSTDGANANLLITNDVVDPISGAVPHRLQRCRIRKADVPG